MKTADVMLYLETHKEIEKVFFNTLNGIKYTRQQAIESIYCEWDAERVWRIENFTNNTLILHTK